MNRLVVGCVAAAGLALAACSPVGQGAGVGAAAGAVVGGIVTGNVQGAAVGAAIGAAGGALVGATVQGQPGYCYMTNQNGQQLFYGPNGSYVTYNTGSPVVASC